MDRHSHSDPLGLEQSAPASSAGTSASLSPDLTNTDGFPEATLRAAQDGSPVAFAAIVKTYDQGLRCLAYRLLDDVEATQDAMQEAWLAIFRGLPGFRGQSALKTWLFRITYRVVLRQQQGRSQALPLPAEALDADQPTPDHADAVVARRDLAVALARLPDEQRAALLLVDREGLTYDAAAEVLRVPVGTVASRLHVGRAALRRSLAVSEE
jgi:RNA polymerase sigma-70 factor (ECF subfamily)